MVRSGRVVRRVYRLLSSREGSGLAEAAAAHPGVGRCASVGSHTRGRKKGCADRAHEQREKGLTAEEVANTMDVSVRTVFPNLSAVR